MNESKLINLDGDEPICMPCQVCIHHRNKPSRCERLDMNTPRKKPMPCCEPSKTKLERKEGE